MLQKRFANQVGIFDPILFHNLVSFEFDNSNKLSSEINLDDNSLGSGVSLKSQNVSQVKQSYVAKSQNLSLIEVIVYFQ